jgi:hypothetical protein
MNAVMGGMMVGPAALAGRRADAAAKAMERAGHNGLMRAAVSGGIETTYKMAGLAGAGALKEYAAATLEGRAFNADAWRAETLNGVVMMAVSDPGAFRRFRPESGAGGAGVERFRTSDESRQRSDDLLSAERDLAQARESLVGELARATPDPAEVGRLSAAAELAGKAVEARLAPMKADLGAETVEKNIATVRRVVATLEGAAIATQSNARVRDRVVEIDGWDIGRLKGELERAGLEVTQGKDGFIARDAATGEQALFVGRRYASPKAEQAARRKALALERSRLAEIERLGRLPQDERAAMRETFSTRWDRLGTNEAHTSPKVAERAQKSRAALEAVLRRRNADMVPVPGLAASQGRRAQVRFENGRPRVEYDPAEATFLDIREEARHLGREVATGKLDPDAGIPFSEAKLAELREAQDRLARLCAVGAEPDLIDRAANRLEAEREELGKAVTDEAPRRALASLDPATPPDVVKARGLIWQAREQVVQRSFELGQYLDRLISARRHLGGVASDPARAARRIEILDNMVAMANQYHESLMAEHTRLSNLRVRDSAAAQGILAKPPKVPRFRLPEAPKVDVRPEDFQSLGAPVAFDAAAVAAFQARYAAAKSPEEKVVISRQMGEAAAEPGGPTYDIVMKDVHSRHGEDVVVKKMLQGIKTSSGIFDFVYSISRADGTLLEVVIIEAKGGKADLEHRVMLLDGEFFPGRDGTFRVQQGTAEHTINTLFELSGRADPDAETTTDLTEDIPVLERMVEQGLIAYYVSRAPSATAIEVARVNNQDWPGVYDAYTRQALELAKFAMPDAASGAGGVPVTGPGP